MIPVILRLGCGVTVASLLLSGLGGQRLDEYQVKAAFICNFANFVEWPPPTYRSPADPFMVCVLGRNPFGSALESMAAGRMVDGHPFTVRQMSDVRQSAGCQIVFVSESERLRYRLILDSLKTSSILSVGETSGFISEGGIVVLRVEDGRVRIEIDAQAAKQKNLRISAHLLDLAHAGHPRQR